MSANGGLCLEHDCDCPSVMPAKRTPDESVSPGADASTRKDEGRGAVPAETAMQRPPAERTEPTTPLNTSAPTHPEVSCLRAQVDAARSVPRLPGGNFSPAFRLGYATALARVAVAMSKARRSE